MNEDGSAQRRLTDSPAIDTSPVWSPNGDRLLYVRLDATDQRDIWITSPDGSDSRNLTNTAWDDHHAAWSPDAESIVFMTTRDGGNAEIYRMGADGTDLLNLTRHASLGIQAGHLLEM